MGGILSRFAKVVLRLFRYVRAENPYLGVDSGLSKCTGELRGDLREVALRNRRDGGAGATQAYADESALAEFE